MLANSWSTIDAHLEAHPLPYFHPKVIQFTRYETDVKQNAVNRKLT